MYHGILVLHVTCAMISLALFCLRGVLSASEIDWRKWRLLRWLPHANDAVLLGAAVFLVASLPLSPLQQPWLIVKIAGVIVYILLGRQALKPGLPRRRRLPWFLGALVAAGYVVALALTKHLLPV